MAGESQDLQIRPALPGDVELLLAMIRELADYEQLSSEAVADPEVVRSHLFGPTPRAQALVAEWAGAPAGFALYFHSFSTFLGRPGLYLEDLFVRPAYRRRGVARSLLGRLARIAVERDCGRMEWSVLDWNAPAIAFYRQLGARPMEGWTVYRLTGAALGSLAEAD